MLRIFKQYYPIRNIFFVIGEGVVIFLSVLLASIMVFDIGTYQIEIQTFLKVFLITGIIQTSLYYTDLYDITTIENIIDLSLRLLQALGIATIILAVIYYVFPFTRIETNVYLRSVVIIIILVCSWRYCYSTILQKGLLNKKVIIIGADNLSQNIIKEINSKRDCGYSIACIILNKHHPGTLIDADSPIIRKSKYIGLSELAVKLKIDSIVVGIKQKRGELPSSELLKCRIRGVEVIEGNSFYEMLTGKLDVEQINPSWLIFSEGFQKSKFISIVKRTTDLILSIVLLIALIPLLAVISLSIILDTKGPIIFSQERVGQKRKSYRMYKFRSMVQDAEKYSGPVWANENDDRITRVGKIIRKLRFDELPQIWNVLKGEMSFVGPRPEREYFVKKLEKTIPYYIERFSVKPGITGWAQVCYNYGASEDDAIQKLNYDLFYIKNMSVYMDLMIILKTIKIVIFGKGAR